MFSPDVSILLKTVRTILGIIPYISTSSKVLPGPVIVCDLPDEVCPYANMVPLKPSKTESIIGRAEIS